MDIIIPSTSKMGGIPEKFFYSGARYFGALKAKNKPSTEFYDVYVHLQHVDRETDTLSGLISLVFTTRNYHYNGEISPNHPNNNGGIYFEGEIIGKKHSFTTRKWFSTAESDRSNWIEFPGFFKYKDEAFTETGDILNYDKLEDDTFIFMRWKETSAKCSCARRGAAAAAAAAAARPVVKETVAYYYVCLDKTSGMLDTIFCENLNDGRKVGQRDTSFLVSYQEQRSFPIYEFR